MQILGSFNQWKAKLQMERVSHHVFELQQQLPPGTYQYKFIVDGQWRCADDQEKVKDEHGNENNRVVVEAPPPYAPPQSAPAGYP